MYRIPEVSNYYGFLYIKEEDGKYYWMMDDVADYSHWKEISKELYLELLKKAEKEDE